MFLFDRVQKRLGKLYVENSRGAIPTMNLFRSVAEIAEAIGRDSTMTLALVFTRVANAGNGRGTTSDGST